MSDDQALAAIGLVLVAGVLLGVVWIFFNPVVDLVLALAAGLASFVWWRARRS